MKNIKSSAPSLDKKRKIMKSGKMHVSLSGRLLIRPLSLYMGRSNTLYNAQNF